MTAHEDRFVPLAGAFNFRDLGGLTVGAGSTTRFGVMFRSDALHHLEPGDVEILRGLGMQTIIDLRSAVELERSGRGPLGDTDISFLHAPLSHGDAAEGRSLPPALADGDLGRHYVTSLDERTETLARVIDHLAQGPHLPATFHCTAGKDRTGMVAALVLSLVGVPDEVIIEDYTLTDARMALVMERIRTADDYVEPMVALPPGVGRAVASSMEAFLAALHDRYGGAEGWARSAGLTDEALTSLRAALVDTTT